jgi:hypothetical protein
MIPPDDRSMLELFATLEPDGRDRARIEDHVVRLHLERERSLAREWLDLLAQAPIRSVGLAIVAAASVLLGPIGAIVHWLATRLGG